MEYHTVSWLIRSPPGYHRHYDGGQLMEAIQQMPHTLILLDEIEKAHERVLNLLLQILDDGRHTDGMGKTIDFTNNILILTSNVATKSIDEVRDAFKVELLNRFDQVVVFKPLEKVHIEKTLEIMIGEFCATVAAKKNIEVEISRRLKERLILEGYDERYDAQEGFFASLVKDKLAEEILNGSVARRARVITYRRGGVSNGLTS